MKIFRLALVRRVIWFVSVVAMTCLATAYAGEVEIVSAKAEKQRGNWVFHVTLRHADSGWDHYADAWRVVTGDGKELGTRTLYHPHENEQPFTRSLADVAIPADVNEVFVEAHDKMHGWSKQRYKLKIR